MYTQFFSSPHDFLPIGQWINALVHALVDANSGTLDAIGSGIDRLAATVENGLQAIPAWLVIAALAGVGLRRRSWRFAVFTVLALLLVLAIGYWPHTMITLGLTLSATFFSLAIGIPLGICTAQDKRVQAVVRPVLDFMQTMPAFVYLIPAAMLFGLGRVPGVIATVIFAMPPAVRLTALGIGQVHPEQIEAGQAFGANRWQLLWKIQLPLALPVIMTGVNQTIMMALSMVIVTSMVGGGGLGSDVLTSIQQLDVGMGFESGICVVLLAIVLDRITESFGEQRNTSGGRNTADADDRYLDSSNGSNGSSSQPADRE